MEIKIPKNFRLGGTKFTVEISDSKTNSNFATFDYVQSKITLYKTSRGVDISKETLANSFIHEVVHAILDVYNYNEESENEKLVSALASGLCQVLETKEGEINIDEL